MSKELIAKLRAELAQLRGPARLPGLVKLGQALMAECYRLGPNPVAKPDLDASIVAFDEAYSYLDADDPVRGHVAGLLGFQLTFRYGMYGGADRDRETGIHLLEEALSFPGLPASLRGFTTLSLGQLYLARAMGYLQTGAFSIQTRSEGTGSAEALADADRASACVRPLVDEPIGDEVTTAARTLLEMADAVRAMLGVMGGEVGGLDLGRLTGAITKLQGLFERMRQQGPAGYRLPAADLIPLGALNSLASLDPLDRPVAVVQGRQPANETAPPIVRPAPTSPPDPVQLRRSLSALLPLPSGGDREAIWLSAADLLRPAAPKPDVATVDELVALAATSSSSWRRDLIRPESRIRR